MEKIDIYINTDFIKLDSFLKFAGVAQTGGHAKEIVAEGACFVNGEQCLMRGKKLRAGDIVKIDDYEFTVRCEK